MRLIPDHPRVPGEVIEAIGRADWVILGPGSWYTSVLPHLMIPEIANAIQETSARRLVVMNLRSSDQEDSKEVAGMDSRDLLRVLLEAAPGIRFDALVAGPPAAGEREARPTRA
jgi:uncharacterized cofD-like protein